eukprot:CAMPEP_0197184584 /NCGR_PEP_ID=MMETSP1423-20130617/10157_1 /TAXON_ID=476441 /ORGANISM="Pseudo-nitzschia heimii, Strain UNC1101" /LENGTH=685 /DNA_ID=CAMNT_0042635433 /DNA_START=112 /DNA_END=2165 /DNA_ORIENTATION=+
MLSGTLKERLAQYKTLKEEEKRNTELTATKSAEAEDAPGNKLGGVQGDALEGAPSLQSASPSDTVSPDSNAVSATPEDDSAKKSESELEPDMTSSHVEEVVEEEIIEDDSEMIEVAEEEDDEEEAIEVEVEVEIEESSASADEDVSSEGVIVETAQQRSSETNQGASEEDQDVFKALDEAERADNAFSSSTEGVPAKPEPRTTWSKANVDSELESIKSKGRNTSKCMVMVVVLLLCAVAVAIILPFFLDYPSRSRRGTTEPSQQDTPESPSEVPTPEPTGSPLARVPTFPPTDAPTTLQWGQFLNAFLIPNSGEEVFRDKDSPQYRAAKFVLDDPYTDTVSTTSRLNDRYACVTFYFATDGENWKSCYYGDSNCVSGQWLEGDVCDWYAVSCDDDGRVTSFLFANAEGNGLVGTLPQEIKLLSAMTDLVIVNNTIMGSLPDVFGQQAESMRSLLLPQNKLTGVIPSNYLNKSPLQFVHLGSNALRGTVPSKIGDTASLKQLDLSGNLLTGTIPGEIGGYEAIEALSIANNLLTGSIPEGTYDLSNLKFLHLNGNEIIGSISTSIGDLSSLRELRIGGSQLTGHIPDELYTLTDLMELDISQAQFSGKLSFAFSNLKKLEKLIVNGNELSGTIPNSFGDLSSLSVLNLQENVFDDIIPEEICLLFEESLEILTADCEEVTCLCCST